MRTWFGLFLFVVGGLLVEPVLAASENAKRDANRNPVVMGVTGDAAQERRMFRLDPNTGQLLVSFSRTWSGAQPEVYLIGVPFSQTVHGNVIATLDIDFSQTIHGDVNASIVAVAFSQTIHGNVIVTSLPAITGTVNATIVHIPFSQTMHGNVIVTSMPAVTGTIDATIVHIPFSQTVHGNVVVTSLPAITGAVDSSLVDVDFSQTMHGNVVVTSMPAITGTVEATITHTLTVTGTIQVASQISGTVSLGAGYSYIGKVDVSRLPAGERTNSLLYSDQFDNAAWTSERMTVVVNADRGPGGRPTAEELRQDSATGYHAIYSDSLVFGANTTHCLSFDVKDKGQDWIAIGLYDFLTDDVGQYFNIAEGRIGNSAGAQTSSLYVISGSPRIFRVQNGYWRCQACFGVEGDSGAGQWGTSFSLAEQSDNDSYVLPFSISYAGDSTSGVYITNGQLEENVEFPGPHIRTEGSAVTSGTNYQLSARIDGPVTITVGATPYENTFFREAQLREQYSPMRGAGGVIEGALAPATDGGFYFFRFDSRKRLWTALDRIDFSVTTHGAVMGWLEGEGLTTWTFTTDGVGRVIAPVVATGIRITASQYEVPVSNAGAVNLFPNNLPGATHIIVQNTGVSAIFVGNANVTAAAPLGTNGVRVNGNGGSISFDAVSENFELYGIGTKAAADDVRVMRW